MITKSTLRAGLCALALSFPVAAWADEATIDVSDAYARASGPSAKSGAAFMVLRNTGDADDRLIEARSDVAKRVELHTHTMKDGVMKMGKVESLAVPAGGAHELKRGGDHVMFMGLNQPFNDGETIDVTLIFENAGEVVVEIPVDLSR